MHVIFGPEAFGQPYGGVSRYYAELHRRLPRQGLTSEVFAGLHSNFLIPGLSHCVGVRLPLALNRPGIRSRRERLNDMLLSARLARVASPAATVYHKTYYIGSPHDAYRGPVATTVYDLIHAKFPQYFAPDDPTVEQQRAICNRADVIFAISHTTKADLVDILGIAPGKIVVTPLGVDTPPAAKPTFQRANSFPFLLYVGERAGYKNWRVLLTAFGHSRVLRDYRLVCAGGGRFTPDEDRLLEDMQLRDRVSYAQADDGTLDELYRAARCLVYPSLYEGFGLPPLEALARGCPVAASRTGSVPEVLERAAEYFDPKDVNEIQHSLEMLVTDEDTRRAVLANGKAVVQRYTWERTVESTVQAYLRLLAR